MNNKLFSYGIAARIFAALMFTILIGLLFKLFILFPNEVLFDSPMEYTSTRYSYKPGQVGWTYEFFVLSNEGLFVKIFVLFPILTAFLFYFGVFSAIASILNLKTGNTKATQRDLILTTIVAFLFFGLPQVFSFSDFFGINKSGPYWIQERIVTPNNTTWEIATQKMTGHYIKDNATVSNDSSYIVINSLNKEQKATLFSNKIGVNGQKVKTFVYKDTLWIFQKKAQYLKAYNMRTEKEIIKSKDDLLKMMPKDANIGIAELDFSPARKQTITIVLNDGEKYYLHTHFNTLTKKRYIYNYDKAKPYSLKLLTKHKSILQSNTTQLLDTIWNTKVFLDAELLASDSNLVIIRHKPNVKKTTRPSITAYTITGAKKLWEYAEENSPLLEKVYGSVKVKAYINNGNTLLNIYDTYTLKGSVLIDKQGNENTQIGTLDIFKNN